MRQDGPLRLYEASQRPSNRWREPHDIQSSTNATALPHAAAGDTVIGPADRTELSQGPRKAGVEPRLDRSQRGWGQATSLEVDVVLSMVQWGFDYSFVDNSRDRPSPRVYIAKTGNVRRDARLRRGRLVLPLVYHQPPAQSRRPNRAGGSVREGNWRETLSSLGVTHNSVMR